MGSTLPPIGVLAIGKALRMVNKKIVSDIQRILPRRNRGRGGRGMKISCLGSKKIKISANMGTKEGCFLVGSVRQG